MSRLTKHVYIEDITAGTYFLAGDIGGTNSNFAVVRWDYEIPQLVLSLHARSQEVTSYADLINEVCDTLSQEYNITVQTACFGIAGVVHDHSRCIEPTNLEVTLDADQITHETPIEQLVVINDFVAVATGIDHVAQEDCVPVLSGSGVTHGNKAALGAGTGLGKVAMVWHRPSGCYIPIPSEGGHADFACHGLLDSMFVAYLRDVLETRYPISWEHVLSGSGIRHIYQFLQTQNQYPDTDVSREIASSDFNPDKISQYAQQDPCAHDTFDLYARWSGRCAKNFALDTLALNGVYIAGGIAAKNLSVFRSQIFADAFYNGDVHRSLLRETPVYVIADYNVSLYGAAAYYKMYERNII